MKCLCRVVGSCRLILTKHLSMASVWGCLASIHHTGGYSQQHSPLMASSDAPPQLLLQQQQEKKPTPDNDAQLEETV
jgi:hypothetical protein